LQARSLTASTVSDVLPFPPLVETHLRLGHYALWDGGLHHRDISNGNLMFFNFMDITIGVLNDFDLAIWDDPKGRFAQGRAGTWCFMALRLQKNQLEHIYGRSI
jgi:hypothetical protein